MPALDNFLSYGADVFKTRQDYKNMVLDVYTKCLNSSQLGESDFINGCKLADSIMLNLRGHVDDVCLLTFSSMYTLMLYSSSCNPSSTPH